MNSQTQTSERIPYFAYGSNMNFKAMAKRCPNAEFLGKAVLRNFQFSIYSDGYATVLPSPGTDVWGGFWMITEAHLKRLDQYEGVPQGIYFREMTEVELFPGTTEGVLKEAWVYFATDKEVGIARPRYMHGVIRGAEDCGLPEGYLPELKKWLR